VRLEDVLSDVMSAPRQERCSQARLQIVLVCPIFLDRVLVHSGRSDCLSALLQTNRMLALLVGVAESDVTDPHKTGECCSTYFCVIHYEDVTPSLVVSVLQVRITYQISLSADHV